MACYHLAWMEVPILYLPIFNTVREAFTVALFPGFIGISRLVAAAAPSLKYMKQKANQNTPCHVLPWTLKLLFCLFLSSFHSFLSLFHTRGLLLLLYLVGGIGKRITSPSEKWRLIFVPERCLHGVWKSCADIFLFTLESCGSTGFSWHCF